MSPLGETSRSHREEEEEEEEEEEQQQEEEEEYCVQPSVRSARNLLI